MIEKSKQRGAPLLFVGKVLFFWIISWRHRCQQRGRDGTTGQQTLDSNGEDSGSGSLQGNRGKVTYHSFVCASSQYGTRGTTKTTLKANSSKEKQSQTRRAEKGRPFPPSSKGSQVETERCRDETATRCIKGAAMVVEGGRWGIT